MNLVIPIAVLAVFTVGRTIAEREGGHTLPDDGYARKLYKDWNLNNDDYIDFSEVKYVFNKMDGNDDGLISKLEYVEAIQAEGQPQNVKVFDMFGKIDTNVDGKLDIIDFRRIFHLIDADDNGHVTEVEFVPAWIKIMNS